MYFAVQAELGRSPVFSFICGQTLKYWQKLLKTDSDRILKSAYLSELDMYQEGKTSWVSFITQVLELINQKHLWYNPDPDNLKKHLSACKKCFADKYSELYFQQNYNLINEHSKLRTYAKFKTTYDREKYLQLLDLPFSFRKLFCAFRISCHDLEIERQRYRSPRIHPDQRICKICQLEPETE